VKSVSYFGKPEIKWASEGIIHEDTVRRKVTSFTLTGGR